MGPAVGALALAMLGGVPLYHSTFARRLPETQRFLSVYLGAVAWQLLHYVEEFATGFQQRLPALLGTEEWSDERFLAFNMVFYALFLVGAIGVLRGIRPLAYFVCFFILAMFLNGVGHAGLALWVGGYFPGLGTGLVSFAWALALMRQLVPGPTR